MATTQHCGKSATSNWSSHGLLLVALMVWCIEEDLPNLADWDEKSILGGGADGHVRLARTSEGVEVAIKLCSLETDEMVEVFENEAYFSRLCADLDVSLPVHTVFITPELTGAVVFERASKDLMAWLESTEERFFSLKETASLFRQVCQLVERMHNSQVAHLDIKPDNILIDKEGHLRLCDFGRAHEWTEASRRYDGPLDSVSTKQYTSPERFFNDDFDVALADIFSLGVTLHVLLTGYFPWNNLSQKPPYPFQFCGAATQGLDSTCLELLMSMLNEDPLLRPTIQQVLAHEWLCQ